MHTSRHTLLVAALLLAGATSALGQSPGDSLLRLLPRPGDLHGWSTLEGPRIYNGEDLFQLIDGGAVLFLEYGYRRTVAVEYRDADDKSINLEIYEMQDPEGAYGIYSIRSGENGRAAEFGQESIVNSYFIMFWKSTYYITIGGSDTSAGCRRGLEMVAKAIDRNISTVGERPRILSLLPRRHLIKQSFVRGTLGLSSIYMPELKDLSRFTEGTLGKYPGYTLLLLSYGDSANARIHFAGITEDFRSSQRFRRFRFADRIVSVTDDRRRSICVSQSGQYLLYSLSARASTARRACKRVLDSLPRL